MNKDKVNLHMRRFGIGMTFYVIMLFLWVFVVVQLGSSIWSYLATLLPLLPAVYAMYNIFLGIRNQDELEQQIQLEACFVSLAAVSTFAFTWGLLEYAGLVPHFHTFLFAPGAIGAWGVASSIIRRRFLGA